MIEMTRGLWTSRKARAERSGLFVSGNLILLFPDAEMGEDVAEDVVGMHSSRDFPEVVKGLPRVHGDQVSRDAVPEPVTHCLER